MKERWEIPAKRRCIGKQVTASVKAKNVDCGEKQTKHNSDKTGSPSPHIRVIIADDLTGACDAGVQFAKLGISTSVLFKEPSLQDLETCTASVLVHDTETRNMSARMAYSRIRRFSSLCKRAGAEIVYKKVDSTLRGNLGAELDGLLDAFGQLGVVISPAYPEYQRTVVNGKLLIGGIPVDKTEFAKDPLSPVRFSDVKTLISLQTTKRVGSIYLPTVRRGSRSVAKAIRDLGAKGIRIFCADAENRTDLKSIADACIRTRSMPCGSAGLGEEIAVSKQYTRSKIMVVSASTNPATMNELKRLVKESRSPLVRARALALVGKASRKHEIERIGRLAQKALATSHEILIVCSALYRGDLLPVSIASKIAKARRGSCDPIASGLAAAISYLILSGSVNAVLMTGGEMAAAFLNQIKAGGLRLESEIIPGIALGRVASGIGTGLKVVTKAGGFGFPGSLAQTIRYLSTHV
jgi:uncharacterized protein YgbK (DUF1537 family)